MYFSIVFICLMFVCLLIFIIDILVSTKTFHRLQRDEIYFLSSKYELECRKEQTEPSIYSVPLFCCPHAHIKWAADVGSQCTTWTSILIGQAIFFISFSPSPPPLRKLAGIPSLKFSMGDGTRVVKTKCTVIAIFPRFRLGWNKSRAFLGWSRSQLRLLFFDRKIIAKEFDEVIRFYIPSFDLQVTTAL